VVGAENTFANTNIQAPPATFTEAEQEKICSSLKTVSSLLCRWAFSQRHVHADILPQSNGVHNSLLDAWIAKHDSVFDIYVSAVSELLRKDENLADTIALVLADMTPSCQETTKETSENLANKFSNAIDQYHS
jgi:hypothetical protein